MGNSYPGHRRSKEGGVGRDPELPLRAHRLGRRLPRARQVGEGHRRRVGQPCDAALGAGGLEERGEEASCEDHATG